MFIDIIWPTSESMREGPTRGHGGYSGYDLLEAITTLLEYLEARWFCNKKLKNIAQILGLDSRKIWKSRKECISKIQKYNEQKIEGWKNGEKNALEAGKQWFMGV